ncbi:hypothetical protein Q8A73_009525 [Channa argus]|nr:hypothetical protein Q8A73_009525 [Channa argus]
MDSKVVGERNNELPEGVATSKLKKVFMEFSEKAELVALVLVARLCCCTDMNNNSVTPSYFEFTLFSDYGSLRSLFFSLCLLIYMTIISANVVIILTVCLDNLYKVDEVNQFVIVVLSLEFLIIPPISNPLVYGLKLPQIRGRKTSGQAGQRCLDEISLDAGELGLTFFSAHFIVADSPGDYFRMEFGFDLGTFCDFVLPGLDLDSSVLALELKLGPGVVIWTLPLGFGDFPQQHTTDHQATGEILYKHTPHPPPPHHNLPKIFLVGGDAWLSCSTVRLLCELRSNELPVVSDESK